MNQAEINPEMNTEQEQFQELLQDQKILSEEEAIALAGGLTEEVR